jgi:hypothetical protein
VFELSNVFLDIVVASYLFMSCVCLLINELDTQLQSILQLTLQQLFEIQQASTGCLAKCKI